MSYLKYRTSNEKSVFDGSIFGIVDTGPSLLGDVFSVSVMVEVMVLMGMTAPQTATKPLLAV